MGGTPTNENHHYHHHHHHHHYQTPKRAETLTEKYRNRFCIHFCFFFTCVLASFPGGGGLVYAQRDSITYYRNKCMPLSLAGGPLRENG
jgi:hypothetical protein